MITIIYIHLEKPLFGKSADIVPPPDTLRNAVRNYRSDHL